VAEKMSEYPRGKTVWFDLDNSPHVPLFRPVIGQLGAHGVSTLVTARDYAQTLNLLKMWNVPFEHIGRHGGKNKLRKVLNLFARAYQLRSFVKNKKIDLALSHGSRTQVVAACSLGIKSVVMLDYEYTETAIFNHFASLLLMPQYIPEARLKVAGIDVRKVIRYNGFKEQLYLSDFKPDLEHRKKLGVADDAILITIRPPALAGNYHNALSEKILVKTIRNLVEQAAVHLLLVSRIPADQKMIRARFGDRVHFLQDAVDGLQLIWDSDLFISGGGTMNREAALLGVPAYSIFTGRKPYLDELLAEQGKLFIVDTEAKADTIRVCKRTFHEDFRNNKAVLHEVVQLIAEL
jgi:predicted glycosyltransferase